MFTPRLRAFNLPKVTTGKERKALGMASTGGHESAGQERREGGAAQVIEKEEKGRTAAVRREWDGTTQQRPRRIASHRSGYRP